MQLELFKNCIKTASFQSPTRQHYTTKAPFYHHTSQPIVFIKGLLKTNTVFSINCLRIDKQLSDLMMLQNTAIMND